MNEPIVAIDARLLCSQNTGDTSYWRGLVHGLTLVNSGLKYLLFSNVQRPDWLVLPANFEWVDLPGPGRIWSLHHFPLEAKRRGARVVHAQYNLSPLVGKIGVTTIHDVSFFIGPQWFKPRDRFLMHRTIPASVKRAARVITVSETSKKEIVHFTKCDERKVIVTPNALGDNIKPTSLDSAQAIVRNQLKITGPYVLTVGTRWPRKNMELAIDAISRLPNEMPHKIVVAGGSGWGAEANNSRTVFTGYVQNEELTALYQCADLYIAPSKHEGFGIPLLEAWACDCPVACSTGGALPEVAGDAANIIKGWNPIEWRVEITALLRNSSKLAELRAKGRVRLKAFSWEDTAKKTVDVYLGVIG